VHSLFRHLRVLWRVESVIAQIQLRIATRRYALYACAALIGAFGLSMLNVAAFLGLEPRWGPMWAALATALGDFVAAIVTAGIALAGRPGPELNSALELRQATIDGIETEFGPLQERLGWVSRLARDPLDTALPAILVPLITAIVRGLRRTNQPGNQVHS
jgi:hypothetical protein